ETRARRTRRKRHPQSAVGGLSPLPFLLQVSRQLQRAFRHPLVAHHAHRDRVQRQTRFHPFRHPLSDRSSKSIPSIEHLVKAYALRPYVRILPPPEPTLRVEKVAVMLLGSCTGLSSSRGTKVGRGHSLTDRCSSDCAAIGGCAGETALGIASAVSLSWGCRPA